MAGSATLGPDDVDHPLAEKTDRHHANLAVFLAQILKVKGDASKYLRRIQKIHAATFEGRKALGGIEGDLHERFM